MQQLAPIDANFLYSETPKVLNHIASLQHFKLSSEANLSSDVKETQTENFMEGLKSFLLNRIHLVPYLTRKLKFAPLNLDHPFWVEDPAFDINNHIHRVALPAPGDQASLETLVAKLHSRPMDRSIPLWQITVITGLQDGNIAYYNQAHHACLDGAGGQAATMLLMDNTPDVKSIPAATTGKSEDSSWTALFTHCLSNLANFQIDTTSRNLGMLETAGNLWQRAIDPSKSFGAMNHTAPKLDFNRSIGVERSYSCGSLMLSDVKRIAKIMDCTINDVFVSLCSGALRTLLTRQDKLPARSLIAGCPVSLRKPGDTKLGNNVTLMQVSLATHLKDPRVRLMAVKNSANVAKQVTADIAAGFEPNISLPGLPWQATLASRVMEQSRLANSAEIPFNLIISNVPGPRETLYSNGAEMLTHYPVSIPVHGMGLNITVQSYCNRLYFSITACKKALPNAAQLRDDLITAYLELKQLVMPTQVQTLKPINVQVEVENTTVQPVITEKVA